ncbi:hypothetical protein Tco_0267970 [Tanacetum coccineum]
MFDSYVDPGLIKELIFDKPAAIEGPSNSEKQIPDVNLFFKRARTAVAMTEFVVESKTSGLNSVVVLDVTHNSLPQLVLHTASKLRLSFFGVDFEMLWNFLVLLELSLDLEVFPKAYEEWLNEADVAGSIPVDLSLWLQLKLIGRDGGWVGTHGSRVHIMKFRDSNGVVHKLLPNESGLLMRLIALCNRHRKDFPM